MKSLAKKRWHELFADRPAKKNDYVVRDQRAFAKYKPEKFCELCRQAALDAGFDEFFAIDGIVIRECGDLEAFVWYGSLTTWKKQIMRRIEFPRAFENAAGPRKAIETLIEQYAASERELRAMFAPLCGRGGFS